MSDQTPPKAKTSRIWLDKSQHVVRTILHGIQTLTERLVHVLRSLAMILLFGIVTLIIISAIKNHDTIVVKPFTVSPNLKQQHDNAGSIIANLLKQQLHKEHSQLTHTLYTNPSAMGFTHNSRLVSMEQPHLAGGDIKLPDTGITINHIVDFISSIFGRENLKGMVYEENNRLHVQIELKGHIINFHESRTPENKEHYFQRLNTLFKQNSQRILSAIADDLSAYYYCTQRVTISQTTQPYNESYHELLATCSKAYEPKTTPDDLLALQKKFQNTFAPQFTSSSDKIIAATIKQMEQIIQSRYDTLCQSTTNCHHKVATTPKIEPVVEVVATPELMTSLATPAQAMVKSVTTSFEPNNFVERQSSNPLVSLGLVDQLIQACQGTYDVDLPRSNRLEENATQLFHNELFTEAVQAYKTAIEANCENAPAWANLGILLSTSKEPQWQQYTQAEQALKKGIELSPETAWMYHSLCIAQTLQTNTPNTSLQNTKACQHARELNPASTMLYNKLFYLEVAKQYHYQGQEQDAYTLYQQAAETDNRRTCSLYTALAAMQMLGQKLQIETTQQTLCRIYQNSQPTEEEFCETEFKQLGC